MRIVDALKARNQLAPVHDPVSEEQRQSTTRTAGSQHAQAVVSKMDEIPRRELDFDALGGRMIEHVASADGGLTTACSAAIPPFTGDDVTKYFVAQDGARRDAGALHPARHSRADLEQIASPQGAAPHEREAAIKQRREQMKARTR